MANLKPAMRFLSLCQRPLYTSPVTRRIPSIIATTTTNTAPTVPFNQLILPSSTFSQQQKRYKSTPAEPPTPVPGPESLDSLPQSTINPSPRAPSEPSPGEILSSNIPKSTLYTFTDIQSLSSNPTPQRILIDVREQSEILGTGKIPTAVNIPISSAPDSFFLSPEDFHDRFGFEKPDSDVEVVFYCKAGVRSKAAARLAGQAGFGGKVGEFPGSWVEWAGKGGRIERGE